MKIKKNSYSPERLQQIILEELESFNKLSTREAIEQIRYMDPDEVTNDEKMIFMNHPSEVVRDYALQKFGELVDKELIREDEEFKVYIKKTGSFSHNIYGKLWEVPITPEDPLLIFISKEGLGPEEGFQFHYGSQTFLGIPPSWHYLQSLNRVDEDTFHEFMEKYKIFYYINYYVFKKLRRNPKVPYKIIEEAEAFYNARAHAWINNYGIYDDESDDLSESLIKGHSPERLQQIILEELDLLLELDYEQVEARTRSKKFLKAFGDDADTIAYFLVDNIPEDISDGQKAEALNWLISWAIKDSKVRPEMWQKRYFFQRRSSRGPLGPRGLGFDMHVKYFYEIKNKNLDRFLEIRSISKFASPTQFINIVGEAKKAYDKYKKEQEEASTNVDLEESKIFENEHWTIYVPKTKGASIKLGFKCGWCTASRGPRNEYSNYHKPDNPLIIFVPKSERDDNERYQFHYGRGEFQDHQRRAMVNPYLMNASDFAGLPYAEFDGYMRRNDMFYFLNSLVARDVASDKLPPNIISKARSLEFEGVGQWLEENRGPDGRRIENATQQSLFEQYTPEFIQQIILEELQLLQELNLADVRKRFQGNKWMKTFAPEGFKKIRAAEKDGDDRGVFPSVPIEGDIKVLTRVHRALEMAVPRAEVDESSSAEFLNWLISWAIKSKRSGDERWDGLEGKSTTNVYRQIFPGSRLHQGGLRAIASLFYQIKEEGLSRFLYANSIVKIRSPEHLIDVVAEAMPEYEEYKKEKVQTSTAIDPEDHKIFENSKWIVYIPQTKGAACALGSSKWCTTARKPTATQDPWGDWEDPYLTYHPGGAPGDDPLIIFHLKEDPKTRFQFSYGHGEFVNRDNHPIFDDPQSSGRRSGFRSGYNKVIDVPNQMQFHELNDLVKTDLRDLLPGPALQEADQYSFEYLGGKEGAEFSETTQWKKRWINSHGEFHRVGGPAEIVQWGDEEQMSYSWFQDHLFHREDGPAVYVVDGRYDQNPKIEYWLRGEKYDNVEEWEEAVGAMQEKTQMENKKMKITKSLIEKLIKEELQAIQEGYGPEGPEFEKSWRYPENSVVGKMGQKELMKHYHLDNVHYEQYFWRMEQLEKAGNWNDSYRWPREERDRGFESHARGRFDD